MPKSQPKYPERARWGSVKAKIAALEIGDSLIVKGTRAANSVTSCAINACRRVSQQAVTPRKTPKAKRVFRITRLA